MILDTYVFYLMFMFFFILSYAFKAKRNWFAILAFSIILGFRGCGIDYFGYRDRILYLFHYSFKLVGGEDIGFELPYLLLIKIMKCFSMPSVVFFFILAFLQIFFLDMFIQKFKDYRQRLLLSFFFFTSLLFVECFNTMRQMTAFFIFINLLLILADGKVKKYCIGNTLLYFVHTSAILLLSLCKLTGKDWFKNSKTSIGIYVISVLLSKYLIVHLVELSYLLFTITSSLGLRVFAYMDTTNESFIDQDIHVNSNIGSTIYYLILLIFIVLNGKYYKKQYGTFGIITYNLTYIGFIIQNFIFNVGVQRINYYFFYVSFIVLALISYEVFTRKSSSFLMICYNILLMMCSFAWLTNSIFKEAAGCAPYILSSDF